MRGLRWVNYGLLNELSVGVWAVRAGRVRRGGVAITAAGVALSTGRCEVAETP